MSDVDIIEINDEQAYSAKLTASSLSNAQNRKRGMIDLLGINCAINYLNYKKIRIDTSRSVYKIPKLFEEFKITDIYYKNYRIDVITLFREKTVKIPKIHDDYDIMPHFYFIVQIGSKIREAKMIGFIDAKNISRCSYDSKFFYPTLDLILDTNKFIALTRHSIPTKTFLGKHIDCMSLFLKFMDNDLSSVYKKQLIQHLMNCDSCRSTFINAMDFEKLANNLRYYPELIKKYEEKISITDNSKKAYYIQKNRFEDSINKIPVKENINIENELPPLKEDIELAQDNAFDLSEQSYNEEERKVISKKVIDNIFNEIHKFELPAIKTIIGKKRKVVIAVGVLFFVFIVFSIISLQGISQIKKENKEMAEMEEMNNLEDMYEEDFDYNPTHEARLIPKQRPIEDFEISQPTVNKNAYTPNVASISWEAPENLVKKQEYTKYLQLTGKNIKLNLQNDLLLVNDIPVNKVATISIKVHSNGDIDSVKMIKSSGSPQIDASINKVVHDTLKYMKPPSHGIIAKPAEITLSVTLN